MTSLYLTRIEEKNLDNIIYANLYSYLCFVITACPPGHSTGCKHRDLLFASSTFHRSDQMLFPLPLSQFQGDFESLSSFALKIADNHVLQLVLTLVFISLNKAQCWEFHVLLEIHPSQLLFLLVESPHDFSLSVSLSSPLYPQITFNTIPVQEFFKNPLLGFHPFRRDLNAPSSLAVAQDCELFVYLSESCVWYFRKKGFKKKKKFSWEVGQMNILLSF